MDSIRNWFRDNVDQKQMTTLIVTSVVIGGSVYALRKTGYGKVASVVKGG